MASGSLSSRRIGDKDYQDIVNTIKRMIETKRYACTLEQILKDYRQLKHKKMAFDVYGYTSERDLLEKSKVFKFRVKDGKVYIELMKTVKKKTSKTLKSTSKLSNTKRNDFVSDSDSSRSTSHSESLIRSNTYTNVKDMKMNEHQSKPVLEMQNILEKEKEMLRKLKLHDEEEDGKIQQKSKRTETSDDKSNKNPKKNSITTKSTNKLNSEEKLTKVQLAIQNMLRNRGGKDSKLKTPTTVKAETMPVATTAKEAFRYQMLQEREEMERQINDIQRRKLAGQVLTGEKVLERETAKASVKAKEPVKEEEPLYISEYGVGRRWNTPLTKLNIMGSNNNNNNTNATNSINFSSSFMNSGGKELNFLELHVVNILHTKVSAYPQGFIAENMPAWYQATFEKSLPMDWLELVERSKRFYIEKMDDNKSLLYAKDKYEAMKSEMELEKQNQNESRESHTNADDDEVEDEDYKVVNNYT